MTTLITKQILVPNDRYTNIALDDIYQRASVKSMCEFFENDLGLVQTADTGQLDHNNIPVINVQDIYNKSTTNWRAPLFSYGYKIYVIQDNKNMDPLYLKIQFGLQDLSYNGTVDYRSYTSMMINVSVMGSTNGAGLFGGKGINLTHLYSNTREYPQGGDTNINYVGYNMQSNSYGFYDKENGRLFIALFPNSRFTVYQNLSNPLLRFGFYIEKLLDNSIPEYANYSFIYRMLSLQRNPEVQAFDTTKRDTYFYHQKTGIGINVTDFDYKGASYSYLYPGASTTGQTMAVNPLTGYSSKNNNILFCDAPLVRPYTIVKVTDKNNVQHDYFAITCQSTGVYSSNINNAWLFKI